MKITLTKKDLEFAYEVASSRHNAKSKSFRNTKILFDHTKGDFVPDKNVMPHYIGVIGELAWSKYSGQPIDMEIYKVRDSGTDFNGVEVKTITYNGSGEPELKIKVEEFHSKTPEIYVLAHFDLKKTVTLLGRVTRDAFDKHKKKKKYGRFNPNNYVVPVSVMDRFGV